jgi:adenylate cyclase class 1
MAEAVDFSGGIGRRELDTVRRRFLAFNRDRLSRVQEALRPAQREFLVLLPLLFHTNHPLLPGFVNTDTPAGISNYNPSRGELKAARHLGRSFEYKRHGRRRFCIHGLYLMGSVGTIAHTRASDLDLWLCHQSGLGAGALEDLAAKARRIEQWAMDLGLEAHIFLMDADDFRRGRRPRLSGESSGSTQHGLLLEEFYRSSLWLAGRYPLWWLVPPEREEDYAAFSAELVRKRFVDPDEYLDFGGLGAIAANEFFGAGLWQLYKGISSPYKAVLKILLTETYAQGFPRPPWLALRIKRNLYQGETDSDSLDAYLLMYRQVETYLRERGQDERLELARRCLYFKVAEPLSRCAAGEISPLAWRARRLIELVREWGWSQNLLLDLDGRTGWKIDRVLRERGRLVGELIRSHRLLTDFAAGHGEDLRIDPQELNLLGRRLYTALEQRPGKVERVNPGIADELTEPHLTLEQGPGGFPQTWSLYRGGPEDSAWDGAEPVKIGRGLVELLAWCRINRIATNATRFHCRGTGRLAVERQLGRVFHTLGEALPDAAGMEAGLAQLAGSPYPLALLGFINVSGAPERALTRDGWWLVSDRSDPLSYGSGRRCRLVDLEQLIYTSWGELVAHAHRGAEGLLDALCFYLDLQTRAPAGAPEPTLRFEGHSSSGALSVARRVQQLFQSARRFLTEQPGGRYVIGAGSRLYLVQRGERGFQWLGHDDLEQLLETLSQPKVRFSPPACDPLTLTDTPLPALFGACRSGEQQLFFHAGQGRTVLYLLDESGSLLHQEVSGEDPRHVLLQQQRFLESLARLRRLSGVTEEAATLITGPRFYRLERIPGGGWRAVPYLLPRRHGMDDYLELRLVAESDGRGVRILSLVCGTRELSAPVLGEQLYLTAARLVLTHRSGGDYPIYLTAVELVQQHYGVPPSGVELLTLKSRVERRLNRALRTLAPAV